MSTRASFNDEERTPFRPRSPGPAYLIAVGATAGVAVVQAVIGGVVGERMPFLPFVLSVMMSAWYGGLRPGRLATALGAVAGVSLFAHHAGSIWHLTLNDGLRLAIFLTEGLVISALCEALLRARQQAEAHSLDALAKQRQLEEADRRKNEFLPTLAHEVRNPLATIRNALAVTQISPAGPSALQRSRAVIERQVTLVSRLVADHSDLTRISRGKLQLQTEPVELSDVVNLAVESSRPLVDSHGHRLDVRLPDVPVWVLGDPARLTQVVVNLLTDSAKYTPEGGHIRLAVERDDQEAVVRVRDNGLGIPPEDLPRIFGLGEQVERNMERSEGGLGIGLSLVRRLVEMHGGTVEALSDGPGHGCEYVVGLPLLPAGTPNAGRRKDGQSRPEAEVPGRRILLADDERDVADSLAMLLRLRGNEVRTARDGREALRVAGDYQPDVVFLDVGLPDMSGYQVAQQMRQTPALKDTVLVAVSGFGSEGDRLHSEKEGFHAHLVKPVDPAEITALLAGLPGHPAPSARSRILVVDNDAFIAESFAELLQSSGNETFTARDAPGALRLAEESRPGVVLLDLGLPETSGFEVARRIRAQPWGKDMVLVAMTGRGGEEVDRRLKEAGFDHYLIKPVRIAAILKVLVDAKPQR